MPVIPCPLTNLILSSFTRGFTQATLGVKRASLKQEIYKQDQIYIMANFDLILLGLIAVFIFLRPAQRFGRT